MIKGTIITLVRGSLILIENPKYRSVANITMMTKGTAVC